MDLNACRIQNDPLIYKVYYFIYMIDVQLYIYIY